MQIDTALASSGQKNYELALIKLNCRGLAVKDPSPGGAFSNPELSPLTLL